MPIEYYDIIFGVEPYVYHDLGHKFSTNMRERVKEYSPPLSSVDNILQKCDVVDLEVDDDDIEDTADAFFDVIVVQ